jgi:hypothetical protein
MESCALSDGDLIVILRDRVVPDGAEAKCAFEALWGQLESLRIAKPKEGGAFSQATSMSQLRDKKSLGGYGEDMRVLSKRLLLLLETQPVFANEEYAAVVEEIVDAYAENYVVRDSTKEWVFLLNDLIRYFRCLCVNYQWDFQNQHGKWPIRNVKLRHSRLIMYGGLLGLLGESSKERADKVK